MNLSTVQPDWLRPGPVLKGTQIFRPNSTQTFNVGAPHTERVRPTGTSCSALCAVLCCLQHCRVGCAALMGVLRCTSPAHPPHTCSHLHVLTTAHPAHTRLQALDFPRAVAKYSQLWKGLAPAFNSRGYKDVAGIADLAGSAFDFLTRNGLADALTVPFNVILAPFGYGSIDLIPAPVVLKMITPRVAALGMMDLTFRGWMVRGGLPVT